jgi:hypothetical protein
MRITFEQFELIINDLKNASSEDRVKARAASYAREFGFAGAETEAALHRDWRAYTSNQRAVVFQITYDEYRRLQLRRSGCIERDPAERRRLTKQHYNAKRRAARAANGVSKSAEFRAPLCPSEKAGTVRVPSSVEIVGNRSTRIERKKITFEDWDITPDSTLQRRKLGIRERRVAHKAGRSGIAKEARGVEQRSTVAVESRISNTRPCRAGTTQAFGVQRADPTGGDSPDGSLLRSQASPGGGDYHQCDLSRTCAAPP